MSLFITIELDKTIEKIRKSDIKSITIQKDSNIGTLYTYTGMKYTLKQSTLYEVEQILENDNKEKEEDNEEA